MGLKKTWELHEDPYVDIQPALLNSIDIQRYQQACEIISKEHFDARNLKTASYEVPFEGNVYWREGGVALGGYWLDTKTGRIRQARITRGVPFELPRNSTVYIQPDPYFNVPEFLALRFNLAITFVHQGLLLGTGPLVDPGFQGRLLIPLHNLTSRAVQLHADKGFIWIEFTKLSPKRAAENLPDFELKKFKDDKKNLSAQIYFEKAGGGPFSSVLVDILLAAQKMWARLRTWSVVGMVALFVGFAASLYGTFTLIRDVGGWLDDARKTQAAQEEALKSLAKAQSANEEGLKRLSEELRLIVERDTARVNAQGPIPSRGAESAADARKN